MKKYNKGGQGYAAREDESLGMRTGAERTKRQSMRDRRDESYGAMGNRPNQRINREVGGLTPSKDAMEMAKEDTIATAGEGIAKTISNKDKMKAVFNAAKQGLAAGSSNSISNSDKKEAKKPGNNPGTPSPNQEARPTRNMGGTMDYNMGGTMKDYNMGGTMKNYRRGGVDIEFRDEEGSRLSISMERQEDAGHSPSEADFDKQHTLAAEGIMEVGADVTTIQGHNSRASLGETEGVRGTGAMVKGTKFRGSF